MSTGMHGVVSILFGLLLLLSSGLAQDPSAVAEDRVDHRGWHTGVAAAGTQTFLKGPTSVPLQLPETVTQNLTGRTLIFYFSPSCPHCTAVMPSLVEFSESDSISELSFLGIATSRTTPESLEEYRQKFQVGFPMQIDTQRSFALSAGLQSTPAAIVVEPQNGTWTAIAGFVPWFEGAEKLLQIQLNPTDPFSSFHTNRYMGPTVCAACHRSEANSSSLTHHTIAYATLYSRDRVGEQECVQCHVTGLNAGGFEMGDHHSDFASVSCESCHGPGGPHDGVNSDPRESCEGCHDAKHSIAFSYEKGLPFLDHYKADHMSQEEIRERWAALQSGEAEKPLLAFPDGPTIGPEACQSCHPEEHARWSSGPHAQSEVRFTGTHSATDPDCLSCHRTPKAFGLGIAAGPSETPGVQCESCHGPGGEHASAPRSNNIIGLGDSCPECVIEEVCTSCHTPTWDPNWDLGTRLGFIRDLYSADESP